MSLTCIPSPIQVNFTENIPDGNELGAALDLLASGHSLNAAANILGCPRSTLRGQVDYFNRIKLPFLVKKALISAEGSAFLKRLAVSTHLYFRDICACGLRVIGDFFRDVGLDSLIGSSLGCQWSFGKEVEEGIVDFGRERLKDVAAQVDGKEVTLALDENFHEGTCLVGIEPSSNFLFTEELVDSHKTEDWKAALSPVLALLGVNVVQVSSDCGRSIVALAEEVFKAHHSPDLFHILYNFRKAFKPAVRRVRRGLESEMTRLEKEISPLELLKERWDKMDSSQKGRGRPPDFNTRIDELETSWTRSIDEYNELEQAEKILLERLKKLSSGYHPVSIETGLRQSSHTFAELGQAVLDAGEKIVARFKLSPEATNALEKLARMIEKMKETLNYIDRIWNQKSTAWTVNHKEKFALQSKLVSAAYLQRIARGKGTLEAHEINKLAQKLMAEVEGTIGSQRTQELFKIAVQMAEDFQRSTSMVEGRNGMLSFRHHAFHRLSSLKRQVLSTIHNYVTKRADGTTASERFSGVIPPNLVDWLCERIKCVPKSGGKRQQNMAVLKLVKS